MSYRTVLCALLLVFLAACSKLDKLNEAGAHADAVSARLETIYGQKPTVHLRLNVNGELEYVMVNFEQGLPEGPRDEVVKKVRAVVIAEFGETPQKLDVAFPLHE
nr:hypothetical protein [uncultured Caldimonas sp.]